MLRRVACEGRKALLLSDIGGNSLVTREGALCEPSVVSRLLTEAMDVLGDFGVTQDDINLGNFHLVRGRFIDSRPGDDERGIRRGLCEAFKGGQFDEVS